MGSCLRELSTDSRTSRRSATAIMRSHSAAEHAIGFSIITYFDPASMASIARAQWDGPLVAMHVRSIRSRRTAVPALRITLGPTSSAWSASSRRSITAAISTPIRSSAARIRRP
jgi:hypothetical protein